MSIISTISGTIKNASFNGEDLSDYYFYTYDVVKGLMPEQDETVVNISKISGHKQIDKKYLPRKVTLKGYIEGTSFANLLTRIESLSAFLYSDSDQQLILSDQTDRYYNAQYLDYFEVEREDTYALLDLVFKCNDPFAYAVTADTDSQAGITTSGSTWAVDNEGSFYVYPTITITFNQAQEHIYISNNNISGNRFDISKSFSSGDELEVNCKDETIKLNGYTSLAGFGNGGDEGTEFTVLATDNNEIEVGTDDETLDIDVDMSWNKVYLS